MAAITVDSTVDAKGNPFASVREFYADVYKEKELTYDELSAAVVVNIVNHLPCHGGIDSSRWAPENRQDKIPTSGSIQKISSKTFHRNGLSKNASYKNGSPNNGHFKNGSYKNRFPKSGSLEKIDPRNDFPGGMMLLVPPPLNTKTDVIALEEYRSRGINPLAEEFIPSGKQKSPVVDGGLSTSIYAAEAPDLGTTRVPSLAVVRSPDWTKKTKSAGSHRGTSELLSPISQKSYILPYMRPTPEDAISSNLVPSAKADASTAIGISPRKCAISQKSDGSVRPDAQAGQGVGISKQLGSRLCTPLHSRQNSKVTKYGELITATTRLPSPAHANSIRGYSQSERSEALAQQASSFKSSSPSSGASAWKNHRAIIEQSDKELSKKRSETPAKGAAEYLEISFKDKWIPAVVEEGQRVLKKAITLTVSGVASHAASSGSHESISPELHDIPGCSTKPASLVTFNKMDEMASLNGYILCDWGETTDERCQAIGGISAEVSGVKLPELNTAENVDNVIIDEPAAVTGNRTEVTTFDRSEIANGEASEVARKNQFQNQDTQTSDTGINSMDAFAASNCVIPDWGKKIEDFKDKIPELRTHPKPQVDSSNHATQQDVRILNLVASQTAPEIPNSPSCSVISNGEKFPSAKTEAPVEIKAKIGRWTKIEATSCQFFGEKQESSSETMNITALPPALQGGKLATSWEEFTCGRGKPATFKSYRVQRHTSHTLDPANDTSEVLKSKELTDWNPEVIADGGNHLQDSQRTKSGSHTFDATPAKEFTNLKSKRSTTCEDQQKSSEVSDSAMPAVSAAPPTQRGWLASTWEEFNCGKGKPELPKSYRLQKQHSRTSGSPNIVANISDAPVYESLKDRTQVRDHAFATRQGSEIHSNSSTLTGKRDISAEVIGVHINKHSARGSRQLSPQEANVYPPAVPCNTSSEVKRQNELESPAQVHAALVKEIIDPKLGNGTIPLTRSNLMERTGVAPLETDCWGIDKAVSDDGVEVEAQSYDTNKQRPGDIRNVLVREQGMDLWEGDRAEVDLSYMPAYITSWANNIPMIEEPIDMDCDEFKTGLSPLSQLKFENPVAQPLCYPDIAGSENIDKARVQTSEIDCKHYLREKIKQQRRKDRAYTAQVAHNSSLFYQTPRVDPNAPTISCYLRPAEERDVTGITAIYNHYISDSFIPEDQKRIAEEEMHAVWATARKESLPFIVAIQGPPPDHNNSYRETVLGFARADIYYGLGGGGMGRSRYLGVIEFFTHHQYLRKGIGRSLLDRILCTTSSSYLAKGSYDWVIPNPSDNAVYNHFGGGGSPRRWHQLLIHRPIEVTNDPDYEWLKDWLQNNFYFFEVARLKSTGRTKPVGAPARWLDLVTFQLEASTPGEFEAFQ